ISFGDIVSRGLSLNNFATSNNPPANYSLPTQYASPTPDDGSGYVAEDHVPLDSETGWHFALPSLSSIAASARNGDFGSLGTGIMNAYDKAQGVDWSGLMSAAMHAQNSPVTTANNGSSLLDRYAAYQQQSSGGLGYFMDLMPP